MHETERQIKSGAELISEERQAHFTRGYDPSHDDGHTDGALAYNAACLLIRHIDHVKMCDDEHIEQWNLAQEGTRTRCLVIAGALIAAEIDRLQRAGR